MATFHKSWEKEYDAGDNKNLVRTAGVELETTITNHDNPLYGVEECYEMEDLRDDINEYFSDTFNFKIDSIGFDGSQIEFATEPDSLTLYRKGGSKRFQGLMDMLAEDSKPTKADGTHVHISVLSSDRDWQFDNLLRMSYFFSLTLQKIFGRVTTWASTAAEREGRYNYRIYAEDELEVAFIPKKLFKKMTQGDTKASLIINRGDNIEFRGGKGSNDIDEVIAWVELCDNMMSLANREDISSLSFEELLKGKYICEYVDKLMQGDNPRRLITPEEIKLKIKDGNYIQYLISRDQTLIL